MPHPAKPLKPNAQSGRARHRAGRPWGTRFERAVFLSDTQRANSPDILTQLPPKSWVIFRHYTLGSAAREEAARQWQREARACGHTFLVSGDARLARRLGAGLHLRAPDMQNVTAVGALRRSWLKGPVSFAAHTVAEVKRAEAIVRRASRTPKCFTQDRASGPPKSALKRVIEHRAGHMKDHLQESYGVRKKARPALLLSPVFQTRSHRGAVGLGVHGLARLMRAARLCERVALGGVGACSARRLAPFKRLSGVAAIDGFAAEPGA